MSNFFHNAKEKLHKLRSDSPGSSPENSPKRHGHVGEPMVGSAGAPVGAAGTGLGTTGLAAPGTATAQHGTVHEGGVFDRMREHTEHWKQSAKGTMHHLKEKVTGHQ